jgi:hypothetical protein
VTKDAIPEVSHATDYDVYQYAMEYLKFPA